jgi:RNA polymerase sigma-70 factor (ECF subfamily)
LALLNNLQNWWFTRPTRERFHQQPDELVLKLFQEENSSSALEVLISRHGDALYHFLVSLSDTQQAEDVSQHTWLKFIENPKQYRQQKSKFRTWLFGNGRNTLIDELRRLSRWQWTTLDELTEDDSNDWQEDLVFNETEDIQIQFNSALMALPFAQKEALMLQLEGFSLDDIASITHEKPETIKSRLRFARKQLKQTLGGTHESK